MTERLALANMFCIFSLVAFVSATGCGKSAPPAAPAAPAPAAPKQPYHTYLFSNAKAHLRQFPADNPIDAEEAKAVWRNLLAGMVADEKSRDLLRRLHGGLPAEFVLIETGKAEDQEAMTARPGEGIVVAFRVADSVVSEEKLKPFDQTAGKVPVRVVNYCQVVWLDDAATKSAPNMASAMSGLTNVFQELPPSEVLYLLMEDYIHRQAPGWILIRDVSDAEPELPGSLEEHRRALDKKIDSFADRAKAYYDTLRK